MAVPARTKNDFTLYGSDFFKLWEAFQNIDNGYTKSNFAIADNFYLWQAILNLAAMGSGNVTTAGMTPNAVPKATSPTNIEDSQRTDDGTNVLDTIVGNYDRTAEVHSITTDGGVFGEAWQFMDNQASNVGYGADRVLGAMLDIAFNGLAGYTVVGVTESGIREKTLLAKEQIIVTDKNVTVGGNSTEAITSDKIVNVGANSSEIITNDKSETVGNNSTETIVGAKQIDAAQIGLYGTAPIAQQASPAETTEVAGAVYGANEQTMLANLKAEVNSLRTILLNLGVTV